MAFSVINHNAVDASEAEQGEGVLLLHMVLQVYLCAPYRP